MTITSFDRVSLRILRTDLEKAISEVANKHGITIDMGAMRFSESEFRTKLIATTSSSAEVAQAKTDSSADDLAKLSAMHDLPENLLGRKITVQGSRFTISGAKLSRRKYPFSVTGAKGGKYKMSVEDIRGGLEA